jgi:hypothetical protein
LKIQRRHENNLRNQALQVHLDPRRLLVPARPMTKQLRIEIAAQLSIDPGQHILVKGAVTPAASSYALQEYLAILHQVGAKQQRIAGQELAADIAQDPQRITACRNSRCSIRYRETSCDRLAGAAPGSPGSRPSV